MAMWLLNLISRTAKLASMSEYVGCRKLVSGARLPEKAHESDSAFDLFAVEAAELPPNGTRLFKTGIALQLPAGAYALVLSRSGLAVKNSVFVLNAPGLIDNGYRGEIGVVLHNASSEAFVVNKHDRIAQILFQTASDFIIRTSFEVMDDTDRGSKGFGSTGVSCKHTNIVQDDEGGFVCTKCDKKINLNLDFIM